MPGAAHRYTSTELLAAARERGFDATARLLTDWVSHGLLDRPHKRGLGRGKGTVATWPEEQKELLLLLLMKRSEVSRIATLCNIPVAIWLGWGEGYVPIRQVRRALATWAGAGKHPSRRQARVTAEAVVGQLAHVRASKRDRQRLIKAIAEAAYSGDPLDEEETRDLIRAVSEPSESLPSTDPGGHVYELVAKTIRARLEVLQHLAAFDDSIFRWARMLHGQLQREYTQEQPQLAGHKTLGHLFREQTFEGVVNNGCLLLLTTLGLIVLAESEPEGAAEGALFDRRRSPLAAKSDINN